MAIASPKSTPEGELAIDTNFETLYPHHDLLVELGQVEMAMEVLSECDERERQSMQPDLELRMNSLLEALDHLAA